MESNYSPVNDRIGHLAVVWKDLTLIWGGRGGRNSKFFNPKIVHCHQDGVWIPKSTNGQIPHPTMNAVGEVIGDILYVACGYLEDKHFTNELYSLNLKTWMWSKLEPNGTKPVKSSHMVSWISGEKMFLFGGWGNGKEDSKWYPESLEVKPHSLNPSLSVNNQLVYYECQDNSWNWPTITGLVPSPRVGHAAFSYSDSLKSVAFIFGGMDAWCVGHNDIFIFDMSLMKWKSLPHRESSQTWPAARLFHTLTKISSEVAVLFGGKGSYGDSILGDCWIMNIKKAIYYSGNLIDVWTRLEHHENNGVSRLHKAIKEPSSNRLWILGGVGENEVLTNSIRALTFTAPSLKVLATESAAKHVARLSTELEKLPKTDILRCAVEAKARDKYVIS